MRVLQRTSDPSTTGRLLESYSSVTGRRSTIDGVARRHIVQALHRLLRSELPKDRGARILDVGCGEGPLLQHLRDVGYRAVDAFDLSPENVRICHQLGFTFVRQHDALNAATFAPPATYDVVIAFDILEHVPKESAASFLDQLRQLLRPGGKLILQTPNMGSVFATFYRYGDLSHQFGVTEATAAQLLALAGFPSDAISVRPAWSAPTLAGKARELYLRLLHLIVHLADGARRARIASKNLLCVAIRES